MYSVVVKKYGDPDVLEYVKSDSQVIDDKSVKILPSPSQLFSIIKKLGYFIISWSFKIQAKLSLQN